MKTLKKKGGFTLVELLIVIVIIAILMALIIPTVMRGLAQAQVTSCNNNLRELHKCVILYMTRFGGSQKLPPPTTGRALWNRVLSDPTDTLGGNQGYTHALLGCPVLGNKNANGDYYGPITNAWGARTQESYVGSDRAANHAGANGDCSVVRKNSQIETLAADVNAAGETLGD